MDIKNTIEYKYERERQYNKNILNKYDYEKDGILHRCLPKVLFKGNPVLTTFLQLLDLRLILLLKAIRCVEHYKHISSY